MCDIREYPKLYNRAEWILRMLGGDSKTYGFELLKRAIVVWHVEKEEIVKEADMLRTTKEQVLTKRVEQNAPMEFSKRKLSPNKRRNRNWVDQLMLEEIRSISKWGEKKTIVEFVDDVSTHIF